MCPAPSKSLWSWSLSRDFLPVRTRPSSHFCSVITAAGKGGQATPGSFPREKEGLGRPSEDVGSPGAPHGECVRCRERVMKSCPFQQCCPYWWPTPCIQVSGCPGHSSAGVHSMSQAEPRLSLHLPSALSLLAQGSGRGRGASPLLPWAVLLTEAPACCRSLGCSCPQQWPPYPVQVPVWSPWSLVIPPSGPLLLTERPQVLRLEDLLQGWDVNHGQLPQEGPKHRVQEHVVPEEADLEDQLGLRGRHTPRLRQGCPSPRAPEGAGQGPVSRRTRFSSSGRKPRGSRSHLRATSQGIEEVKEHKTGEGHGCGTRGARLVLGDLEHKCVGEVRQPLP